jgi:hypothetical protein
MYLIKKSSHILNQVGHINKTYMSKKKYAYITIKSKGRGAWKVIV